MLQIWVLGQSKDVNIENVNTKIVGGRKQARLLLALCNFQLLTL